MKKSVLGVITIVMLLIMMLSTSVNAAKISADPTKMEKGQIVTVTVSTDEAVQSMQFNLKFDTSKYKFVDNVEKPIKGDFGYIDYNVVGDTIIVSAFGGSAQTLTLQFEALENGENVSFEISGVEFSNDEAVTNAKVEVTIADKEIEPATPSTDTEIPNAGSQTPSTDTQTPSTDVKEPSTSNDEKAGDNGETYIDEDGNEIEKLPQAGSLVPTIIAGIAVIGVVFAGYKFVKNK